MDTLIAGAWLVTLDAERRVIRDGAVAILGDRIVAVGKRAEIEPACQAIEVVDGRRFVLTPGFVNGHIHITEPLIKGFTPETLPFDDGIWKWTVPLYESHLPADQALGARLAVLQMLRSGTTSFIDAGTTLALDAVMAGIADTGIRGRVGGWVMDRAFAPGDDQAGKTDAALRQIEAMMARYPGGAGQLLSAWPILIGHNTCTDALWRGASDIARVGGAGVAAHMSPVADDPDWYLANTGHRPVEHLASLGVLGPHVTLVHMVHVDAAEAALLGSSGTNVTHCPGAAIKGGYGTTRVGLFPEMAEAGVNLLLGTDGSDHADLMRATALMAGLFKDARADTDVFPAHRVLEMATLNGARAMQLAGEIGAIVPGMKADLVLHDLDRPEWRPVLNPVNQLIWSADGRGVHSVWVDGKRVVDDYRCTTIDEDALYAEAQVAAEALIARSGLPTLSAWPMS